MGVILPQEVVHFLAGGPVMGSAEQVVPLLTVDANGLPHACLLCRAQLDANPAEGPRSRDGAQAGSKWSRTGP